MDLQAPSMEDIDGSDKKKFVLYTNLPRVSEVKEILQEFLKHLEGCAAMDFEENYLRIIDENFVMDNHGKSTDSEENDQKIVWAYQARSDRDAMLKTVKSLKLKFPTDSYYNEDNLTYYIRQNEKKMAMLKNEIDRLCLRRSLTRKGMRMVMFNSFAANYILFRMRIKKPGFSPKFQQSDLINNRIVLHRKEVNIKIFFDNQNRIHILRMSENNEEYIYTITSREKIVEFLNLFWGLGLEVYQKDEEPKFIQYLKIGQKEYLVRGEYIYQEKPQDTVTYVQELYAPDNCM